MDDPVFTSSVSYRDPKTAAQWLQRAFGFEVTMAIEGPPESPEMCHYEMSCQGQGRIMLGGQWDDWVTSPAGVGARTPRRCTCSCPTVSTSTASGPGRPGRRSPRNPRTSSTATAAIGPSIQKGHRWTFAAKVRDVSLAEAEAALGQPISATNWA